MVQASPALLLARSPFRLALGLLAALALAVPTAVPAYADAPAGGLSLTLVTLNGPGTAGTGSDTSDADLLARQDTLLAAIGIGEPVYRWTTALNGFAAALTPEQVAQLDRMPGVAAVESDTVRPLAGAPVARTGRLLSIVGRSRA